MFFELIAVLVAGAGGAGLLLLVSRLSGGRLPRWLVHAWWLGSENCRKLARAGQPVRNRHHCARALHTDYVECAA